MATPAEANDTAAKRAARKVYVQARLREARQRPRIGLFLKPTIAFALLKSTYKEFNTDKAIRMAASLAYYATFSLVPLLVIAIAISSFIFGREAAESAISGQIQAFVGADSAKMIQTMIQSAHKPAHGAIATIVGVITLLFGASGVFGEIQDALNTIWHISADATSGIWNLIKARFLSFNMVLVIGFLLLISMLLSAFLSAVTKYLGSFLPVPQAILHGLDLIVSLFVVTVLFAMIFKILPDIKITWRDVVFGAVTTGILFTAGKFLIGLYLGKSISTSTYGAAGSVMLVIAWVYYSALIFYFGAEFTKVYTHASGSRGNRDSNIGK